MSAASPELLGRLLDEHGPALVLYAQQWCETPEDVVQEALLLLVKQAALPDNVVGWLYRVVRNEAISAVRSSGRRAKREAAAAHSAEPWFQPTEGQRLDADVATRALADLPVEQRETIVARLWGGLAFDQIADVTGSTKSTVYRWYERGLAALRERLGICPEKRSGSMT
jgi:RNA polymerase sigma factor (sigma-70 family)